MATYHHHPGSSGQTGGGQSGDDGPPIEGVGSGLADSGVKTQEDVTIDTPDTIATIGGNPYTKSLLAAQVQVQPFVHVYQGVKDDMDKFFLVKGNGALGPGIFLRMTELFLYKAGFLQDLAPQDRATNGDMIPEAGRSAVAAVTTVPMAGAMGIDPKQMGHDLSVLEYQNEWLTAVEWIVPMVRLNKAHTETRLADALRRGVGRIKGLLVDNSTLRKALDKTLKWYEINAKKAQETARDREKVAAKIEAQGHDKAPAGTPGTPGGVPSGTPGTPPGDTHGTPSGTPHPGGTQPSPLPRPHKTGHKPPKTTG